MFIQMFTTQFSACHDNVQAMKFVSLLFRLVFAFFPSHSYASANPRAQEESIMLHEGISARDCNMIKPKPKHCELRQVIPILEREYYSLDFYKLKCNAVNLGGGESPFLKPIFLEDNTIAAPTLCFTNAVPTAGEYLAASSSCNWCYDAPEHVSAGYVNIRKGADASVTFIELDPPVADPCQPLEISFADRPDALEGFNWNSRKTFERDAAGHCKRSVPTAALYEDDSFWGFQHPNCREPIPIRDFYMEYMRQKSDTSSAEPSVPSKSQKIEDGVGKIDDGRLDELEQRVRSSESELEKLKVDNDKLKDAIGDLKNLKDHVDKKMEELEKKVNERESDSKIDQLEDKIDYIQNNYEQMERRQEETTQKLENLCKESTKEDDKKLENKINELENEVENAQTKLDDLKLEQSNKTKSLEEDVLKFDDKINTSCSKIDELAEQITHLSDKAGELDQFHDKIDNILDDLNALTDRIKELESCCKAADTVAGELKDLGDKVSQLESSSEQIETLLANQQNLEQKLDDFIASTETSNDKLNVELRSLGEEIARTNESASANERDVEDLKEINDELIERMSEQSGDWNKYKLEVKYELEKLADAVGTLEEKVAAINSASRRWAKK